MVTIAIAVASEATAESSGEKDDDDDEQNQSERHDSGPLAQPVTMALLCGARNAVTGSSLWRPGTLWLLGVPTQKSAGIAPGAFVSSRTRYLVF
jgi:hypothetical protein